MLFFALSPKTNICHSFRVNSHQEFLEVLIALRKYNTWIEVPNSCIKKIYGIIEFKTKNWPQDRKIVIK